MTHASWHAEMPSELGYLFLEKNLRGAAKGGEHLEGSA